MGSAPTGGARVAQLRKARGISQAALARRAGIPAGSLSKIEIGDRVLTPGIAAALAGTLQMSLGALYGPAEISAEQDMLLEDLRTAIRRYDIPDQTPVPELAQLRAELDHVITLRWQADLAGLLGTLPGLLPMVITYAHATASAQGWALLAEVYSTVYYLAALHRWMDLVDIAPAYQDWTVSQQPDPMVIALATRDRVGTFLHSGDFTGGLALVDRAIATAQAALTGPDQAFATGILHLRGITLAGWLGDRAEAQRHIHGAWGAAEEFPTDRQIDGHLFGPDNTATHVLATEADLGRPREVIRLAAELTSRQTGLPPTRLVDVHISTARAHLDLGDRDSAQASLAQAWDVAPQQANVHPMSREVLRVLISLHQRSNPQLLILARQAGSTG